MSGSERSDFELLEAWRRGDREAGQALAHRYTPLLYRFFRTKLDSGVADAMQQTLLAAVSKRDEIRDDQKFRAYLLGIARNELLRIYRRRTYAGVRVGDAVSVAIASGPSASAMLASKRERRLLLAALRDLPINMQIAVELYYWEELPVAEIAEVLAVAPGTVKSRLFRARELLRERIEACAENETLARSTIAGFDDWAASLHRKFADD